MTDIRVNYISVTFKVDICRCRCNSSLRKYPADFGSAGGQHARQETVRTKWLSARLEGKAHSCFQVHLQGWEHFKMIMRSRSSKMLSLSYLALLETSHYLFVIRWNKNWMRWKLKELYKRYNSLIPGALAWSLWRRTEEWEFALIWSHSINTYLENTTLCQKLMISLDNWQVPLCSSS